MDTIQRLEELKARIINANGVDLNDVIELINILIVEKERELQ